MRNPDFSLEDVDFIIKQFIQSVGLPCANEQCGGCASDPPPQVLIYQSDLSIASMYITS